MELVQMGMAAKEAAAVMNRLSVGEKNQGLAFVAEELLRCSGDILQANEIDIEKAREAGMKESLVDRLSLSEERIEGMAEGLRQVVGLEDPVGEVISMKTLPNGLQVGQRRVPMGVIGIIYESRPNVTADK